MLKDLLKLAVYIWFNAVEISLHFSLGTNNNLGRLSSKQKYECTRKEHLHVGVQNNFPRQLILFPFSNFPAIPMPSVNFLQTWWSTWTLVSAKRAALMAQPQSFHSFWKHYFWNINPRHLNWRESAHGSHKKESLGNQKKPNVEIALELNARNVAAQLTIWH